MDLQNIPAIYPDTAGQAPAAAPVAPAAPAAPVSHRPMRQAGRQLRSAGQLHDVVEACQTVRIACADEEGLFIVPMSFGYDWADPEEIDADEPRLATRARRYSAAGFCWASEPQQSEPQQSDGH